MAKRPLDEVEEFVKVGDVTHPSQNAKIQLWRIQNQKLTSAQESRARRKAARCRKSDIFPVQKRSIALFIVALTTIIMYICSEVSCVCFEADVS